MLEDVIMAILIVMPGIIVRIGSREHSPAWLRRWAENFAKPSTRWTWMRWLKAVPAVQEAQRQALVSYFVRQLPCVSVLILLLAADKRFSLFACYPIVGAWIVATAMTALCWPVPLIRIAFAARRAAAVPAEPFARRLRWYAALVFLLAVFACAVPVCLFGVLLLVSLSPVAAHRC